MNKKKQAVINTLANILLTLINIVVTFFVTRIVLTNYGSDYNGLNTTINQIVGVMLIVESGFALSANVALYRPLSESNKSKIESILSSVNYVFIFVGLFFMLLGIAASFLAPIFIKTNIDYWEIVSLFFLTFIPIGLRLLIAVKYATLLESAQKNYLVNFTKILSNIFILISTFFLSEMNQSYLTIKISYFFWNIIAVLLIVFIFKKTFKNYHIGINSDLSEIKGVKDVLLKKIASVVSSTYPALLLGFMVGTNIVSVFGVYMLVITGLISFIDAFSTGPKDSFGLLISEKNMKKTYDVFDKYAFVIISISAIFFATASVLMIPFVKLYTAGVTDVDYINLPFSLFLVIGSFIMAIQGPYTNVLNGASIFNSPKTAQVIGAITLCIIGIPLTYFFGITGMACSILLHNCIVTFSKMWITYHSYFKKGPKDLLNYFLFIVFPLVITSLLLLIFVDMNKFIDSYISFGIIGLIIFLINCFVYFLTTFIPYKKTFIFYLKTIRRPKKNIR